jgi:GTP-binding protein
MRPLGGPVTFLGSFPGQPPETGLPEVAFAGRSNVGKSSAINRLLDDHSAARVSSRPGRTQLINLFRVANKLVFADLPGYGFAAVPEEVWSSWKPMIEAYLGEREALRLVVVLLDGSIAAQSMDTLLIEGLRGFDMPVCCVATKMDKLSKHQRKPALLRLRQAHGLEESELLPFSARSGDGVEQVWARLFAACGIKTR